MILRSFFSGILFISLLLSSIAIVVLLSHVYDKDLQGQSVIFAALSAISNALLALVAYWQLPAMEQTAKASQRTTMANFLLLLTEKWMHEDMIQARCILHHHALKAKNKNHIPEIISAYVIEMSQDTTHENIRHFAQIISLLEFMEILSGLYVEGQVSLDMLQKLFGGSIERYYHYLQRYIEFRRSNGSPSGITFSSDASLYGNYEQLVKKLIAV
ncbi:MAG: hypothetical protein K2X98_04055 [Alphaproteobacteria bacterium]|nr:hypothetical protein [Alphaproteobacteria bacterium]